MLFFALVVGSIAIAPSFVAPLALGPDYQGVPAQFMDDDDIYRVQIKQLVDGESIASPYLLEYKQEQAPIAPINPWLYAIPAMLLGLSGTLLASKFVLPAALFLLVYVGTRRIVRTASPHDAELLSITAGLTVTLGYDLVDVRHVLAVLGGTAFPSPLVWTRLVNPVIGALEIFGVVILLTVISERRFRFAYVPLGALIALSVGYFFSYGISLAVTGMLLVIRCFRREYAVARELFYAIAIAFILNAGYWYHTLTAVGGEEGRALTMRNGMFYTHEPVINYFLLATSIIVFGAYYFSRWVKKETVHAHVWSYLGAFLGGSWLVFNQQVFTGREIWHPHFVQYVIPLCFVSLLVAGYVTLRAHAPRFWRSAMFLASAVALSSGMYSMTSYVSRLDEFRALQDTAAVFSLLKDESDNCVAYVLTPDSALERLIPAYTPCRVYSSIFVFYGIPEERILHNYLLYLRLQGIDSADLPAYLLAHPVEVRQYFFQDWHQLFASGVDSWLLARFAVVEEAYAPFAQKNLVDELRRYRMDYLITSHPLPPAVREELPGLILAATTPRFFLYSF